jgi:hypothetical protein
MNHERWVRLQSVALCDYRLYARAAGSTGCALPSILRVKIFIRVVKLFMLVVGNNRTYVPDMHTVCT